MSITSELVDRIVSDSKQKRKLQDDRFLPLIFEGKILEVLNRLIFYSSPPEFASEVGGVREAIRQ